MSDKIDIWQFLGIEVCSIIPLKQSHVVPAANQFNIMYSVVGECELLKSSLHVAQVLVVVVGVVYQVFKYFPTGHLISSQYYYYYYQQQQRMMGSLQPILVIHNKCALAHLPFAWHVNLNIFVYKFAAAHLAIFSQIFIALWWFCGRYIVWVGEGNIMHQNDLVLIMSSLSIPMLCAIAR